MARKRQSRDQRPKHPTPIRLMPRDIRVLQALYTYRYLDTDQLQQLFFPSKHRAYERLRQLYEQGYIDRILRGTYMDRMNTPILYVLDKKGAHVLSDIWDGEISWNPKAKHVSDFFMAHTVAINNFRIAITLACETSEKILLGWTNEAELKANNTRVVISGVKRGQRDIALIPDGYFRILLGDTEYRFFLEVDMGTMSLKRFQSKVLAYTAYHKIEQQHQIENPHFRIITITSSQKRMVNLKAVTEAVDPTSRFWFTTLDTINVNTVFTAPIWHPAHKSESFVLLA